jgi:hypothetical protein
MTKPWSGGAGRGLPGDQEFPHQIRSTRGPEAVLITAYGGPRVRERTTYVDLDTNGWHIFEWLDSSGGIMDSGFLMKLDAIDALTRHVMTRGGTGLIPYMPDNLRYTVEQWVAGIPVTVHEAGNAPQKSLIIEGRQNGREHAVIDELDGRWGIKAGLSFDEPWLVHPTFSLKTAVQVLASMAAGKYRGVLLPPQFDTLTSADVEAASHG